MALYKLAENGFVIRTTDGAYIPDDPANRDRQDYDTWLAAGNAADPATPTVVAHDGTFDDDPWQSIGI